MPRPSPSVAGYIAPLLLAAVLIGALSCAIFHRLEAAVIPLISHENQPNTGAARVSPDHDRGPGEKLRAFFGESPPFVAI